MSAMIPGGRDRGGDGSPYVSYTQGGQLIIQRFSGELVMAGSAVEVRR